MLTLVFCINTHSPILLVYVFWPCRAEPPRFGVVFLRYSCGASDRQFDSQVYHSSIECTCKHNGEETYLYLFCCLGRLSNFLSGRSPERKPLGLKPVQYQFVPRKDDDSAAILLVSSSDTHSFSPKPAALSFIPIKRNECLLGSGMPKSGYGIDGTPEMSTILTLETPHLDEVQERARPAGESVAGERGVRHFRDEADVRHGCPSSVV